MTSKKNMKTNQDNKFSVALSRRDHSGYASAVSTGRLPSHLKHACRGNGL